MNEKVVQFPGPKKRQAPLAEQPAKPAPVASRQSKHEPFVSLTRDLRPIVALDPNQRRNMQRIWDLCDHLQRASVIAAYNPGAPEALEGALLNLLSQLNYKEHLDESE